MAPIHRMDTITTAQLIETLVSAPPPTPRMIFYHLKITPWATGRQLKAGKIMNAILFKVCVKCNVKSNVAEVQTFSSLRSL